MIEVVCCTPQSPDHFWTATALGNSLRRLAKDSRIHISIATNNRQGLPVIYNQRLRAPDSQEYLVFVHDDVWIDDYYFVDRVFEGLNHFHLIGLAGNIRRVPNQPSWAFPDTQFHWDNPNYLSGGVAHGEKAFGVVARFGPCPAECQLLDGVFLASRKSFLQAANVEFDERFQFHFYDMDICRSATQAGLKIGTWPIVVTHQSGGRMETPEWWAQYRSYLAKWGD
jgi:GT2 family glycosyltransferase